MSFISFVAFVSDGWHVVFIMSTTVEPSRLSPSDQGALLVLQEALQGSSTATITVGKRPVLLPRFAVGLVVEFVEHLAAGRSVTVLSGEEEISPREAAELLQCSQRQIELLTQKGRIAKPIYLGDRSPRWRRAELLASLGTVQEGGAE